MVGVCEKQLGKDGRVLLITVLIVGHEERVQVWWEQTFVRLLLLHYYLFLLLWVLKYNNGCFPLQTVVCEEHLSPCF